MMSPMTCIGSWYATSRTKLHVPRSAAASSTCVVRSEIRSSSRRIILGVKPALISRRMRV
jgi:hypothetical protein